MTETEAGLGGVLVDESGRRARYLRRLGRAVSVLLMLWLGVLALGALGLEPLGGIPGLQAKPGRITEPPALPERIRAAAQAAPVRASVPTRARVASPPPGSRSASRRRAISGATRRRSAVKRPTLPSAARKAKGTPATTPASQNSAGKSATAPGRTGITPSGNATGGKSAASPGHSSTTPPGQAKTTTPAHAQGTPHQPQGNGKGPTTTIP